MPQTSVSGLEGYLDHLIARMGQSGEAEAGLKPLADL
jgi:hypothetical protein